MIDWLGAVLVVVLFAMLVRLVRLVDNSQAALTISRRSLATMRDASLSDDDKEIAVRRHAYSLLVLLGILTAGGAFALLAPLGLIWLLEFVGLFSLDGVLRVLMRVEFMVGAAILGTGIYVAVVKWLPRS